MCHIGQGSKNTRGLKMIDNFFRLHEKNRKMNFDELFTKVKRRHLLVGGNQCPIDNLMFVDEQARYDFPQNFASAAVGFQDG